MKLIYTKDDPSLINKDCQKIQKILEYTLLLPDIRYSDKPPEYWIEDALQKCYNACYCHLFYNDNYNFFGTSAETDSETAELYRLHRRQPCEENTLSFLKVDFFANTIMMQCVMSAYDVIMQALLSNQKVTYYALINKVRSTGHNTLKSQGMLKDNFTYKKYSAHANPLASSIATGFTQIIKTHITAINDSPFKDLLIDGTGIPLSQSDLVYRLMDVDLRSLKNYLRLYDSKIWSEKTNHMDWNYFVSFYNDLTKDLSANRVDSLYYLYRMEQMFSPGLANCTIQNIYKLMCANKTRINGTNDLTSLGLISTLPNIFSRNLYLQFALESAWNKLSLHDSFFNDLFKFDRYVYRIEEKPFQIHEWFMYFEKFCQFFSELIFPVSEWYFLLLLFETADCHSQTAEKTALEKLTFLQRLLANYIEDHYENILNPLYGKKEMGYASLANYDNNRIIRPAYYKCEDSRFKTIFPQFDSVGLPNITAILSALNPARTHENFPMPNLTKDFFLHSNEHDMNQKKFMAQIISFITT